jgi:hypothetical protein
MDIYNLFNSNTVLDANPLTGPAFGDAHRSLRGGSCDFVPVFLSDVR